MNTTIKKYKLLLVNPRRTEVQTPTLSDFTFLLHSVTPKARSGRKGQSAFIPLALPTLAALTPDNWEVKILDENFEDLDPKFKPDLVGITFTSAYAKRAYELADYFREQHIHVVLGGVHASTHLDEAALHADTVFMGEAEDTWAGFLDDFCNGSARKVYETIRRPNMQTLVVPRWDKVKHHHYVSPLVQASRGCTSNCSFCTVRAIFGNIRNKPVEHVLAEIAEVAKYNRVPGPVRIMFSDDNIISDPQYAKSLFRAMIPFRLSWTAQASIAIVEDPELLELAKASGCDSLLIGFESLSQENLDAINKKTNHSNSYHEAVKKLHAHGISIYSYLIFGFDCDDNTVFSKTLAFLQESGIEFPLFNILSPIPGTRFHQKMAEQGRVFSTSLAELDGYHVCFSPAKMSPTELSTGFRWTIANAFSAKNILSRIATSYREGGLRSSKSTPILRIIIALVLLRTMFSSSSFWKLRLFALQLLAQFLIRPSIKPNALLMFLDRFHFAQCSTEKNT